MILEAPKNGLLVGLAPDLVENGIVVLQYADDTVICITHDPKKATSLKLLLYLFEMMSGLKINFLRSEKVFTIGGIITSLPYMLTCSIVKWVFLPLKYLGVPVTFSNLKNID